MIDPPSWSEWLEVFCCRVLGSLYPLRVSKSIQSCSEWSPLSCNETFLAWWKQDEDALIHRAGGGRKWFVLSSSQLLDLNATEYPRNTEVFTSPKTPNKGQYLGRLEFHPFNRVPETWGDEEQVILRLTLSLYFPLICHPSMSQAYIYMYIYIHMYVNIALFSYGS